MGRNPRIVKAAKELSKYFGAITEAEYISMTSSLTKSNISISTIDPANQIDILTTLATNLENATALIDQYTKPEESLAELFNGSINLSQIVEQLQTLDENLSEQFKVFFTNYQGGAFVQSSLTDCFQTDFVNGETVSSTSKAPCVYAVQTKNPFVGPITKDVGAIQTLVNAIPTHEWSRCVPYVEVKLNTPFSANGASSETSGISLIKFLNNENTETNNAILQSQKTSISSEVIELTKDGTKANMEIFLSPQTLLNLDNDKVSPVPVIDKMRPLMSLGKLDISTRLQKSGGGIAYSSARLEITIHDRSRIREVAEFVRADQYGKTFLDISWGWSHPDGAESSTNSWGKLLDAMKVTQRYRILSTTYTFDEVGQIKVNMSLATVGAIDMLYTKINFAESILKQWQQICEKINKIVEEKRITETVKGMQRFDFLSVSSDPATFYAAASDETFLRNLNQILKSSSDPELTSLLSQMFNAGSGKTDLFKQLQNSFKDSYSTIVNNLKAYNEDILVQEDHSKVFDTIKLAEGQQLTVSPAVTVSNVGSLAISKSKTGTGPQESSYVSFGSAFMSMIALPLAKSEKFEEVQVIFYPFNHWAGAVRDMPISAFPIEKEELKKVIVEISKKDLDISTRDALSILNNYFIARQGARAYLISDFFIQNEEGAEVEQEVSFSVDLSAIKKYSASIQKELDALKSNATDPGRIAALQAALDQVQKYQNGTFKLNSGAVFEKRLQSAGIFDGKFKMPRVEVIVEACPMLDLNGKEIQREDGSGQKTLLKMHVIDTATDGFSTYADVLNSLRDDTFNVIRLAASDAIALNRSTTLTGEALAATPAAKIANDIITKGVELRLLEQFQNSEGISYFRVKGTYQNIKKWISTGMPTIVYGSQGSAVISANLQSNNNAGLNNVQILRSFGPPGDYASENLAGGVPMQINPAQLNITTLGCPLFFPMQRFFVDFGTGTSIDNAYFVTEVSHTIFQGEFKTEIKLGYGQAHATYVSVNQNLSALGMLLSNGISEDANILVDGLQVTDSEEIFDSAKGITRIAQQEEESVLRLLGNQIGKALVPAAEAIIKSEAAINRAAEKAKQKAILKLEEIQADVERKIRAIVPAETLQQIDIAVSEAKIAIEQANEIAAKVEAITETLKNVQELPVLIERAGKEAALIIVISAISKLKEQLQK